MARKKAITKKGSTTRKTATAKRGKTKRGASTPPGPSKTKRSTGGSSTNRKHSGTAAKPGTNSKPASRTGKASAARLARANRVAAPEPPPKPLPKTRLNDKQLQFFRELLLAKRSELLSDVRMLTKDALGKSRKDSSGDLSSMPIHMADIGSDNWEQDFTLGLIANERQFVREIDEALQRIEDRTYGVCLATHKPIIVARLKAKPWAKYCIAYAEQLERRGY